MSDPGGRHRVVVLGGGFGGLQAVRSLRRAPVQVTLVDRRNVLTRWAFSFVTRGRGARLITGDPETPPPPQSA